jgi:hypothetical protein
MKNRVFSFLSFIFLFLFTSCNHNVEIEYYDKDGREKFLVYYPSGKLRYTAEYQDSLLHGQEIEYYENGNIKMKGQQIFGKSYGTYYFYNETQKLDSIVEYLLLENPELDELKSINKYFEQDSIGRNEAQQMSVVENRFIKYDLEEKPIDEKSLFYVITFTKAGQQLSPMDDIYLGDSINMTIFFSNPAKELNFRADSIEIFVVNIENENEIIRSTVESDVPFETNYSVVAANSGNHYFKAMIFVTYNEMQNGRTGRWILIKEPFFVRNE